MIQEWTIPLTVRVSLGTPVSGDSLSATRSFAPALEESASPVGEDYLTKFSLSSLVQPDFRWRTALSLALASNLAYSEKADVERTGKEIWKLATCEFIDADDTQCFVATSADAVLVSFRGTENLGDWMANLNSVSTTREYTEGHGDDARPVKTELHRGFLSAFQVVQKQLENILGRYGARPLLLTGHSLGGALALIAAAEWKGKYNIVCIHTFGQPAVGKSSFCDFIERAYAKKYYRFVNDDDVVPRVPPWFNHCGWLIHYDKQGGLENAVASEELAALEVNLETLPEDTATITESQFDKMRASLFQEKVVSGGAPLDEQAVERAAIAAGVKQPAAGAALEGFFPSVSDHRMSIYVAKTAGQAGL